jgi:hypothetical protein
MSTDSPEEKLPEVEVATDGNVGEKTIGSLGDVPMEDETEKMQKAARQSASHIFNILCFLITQHYFLVEFYFADSNLPFDR